MAQVQMPDGAVVDMPDQLDPALGARLRAFQTAAAAPPASKHPLLEAGAKAVENSPLGTPIAGLENALSGITGGIGSLADAVTGSAPGAHNFAYQPRTPQGQEMQAAAGGLGNAAVQGAAKAGGAAVGAAGGNAPAAEQTIQERLPEALGAAGTIAGVGGLGSLGRMAGIGEPGAAAAETASPAGQLGLRTTTAHPIAAKAAGPSAGPVLDAQNQAVAETALGADAGVPHGVPINPTSLAAARVAPGQVLDAGAQSLPTGPLSPAATAQVKAARGPATITKPTPNVAGQINDLESSLTDPQGQFTGDQIRATRNSLSSDAAAGKNSPDADTRAIAAYKSRLVGALDQHVDDTMPANGPVSPEMVQNARATLAKNYNLQDLIGPGGDVNLQQLAKMHRDNPNLLTGNTATVAQFASDHPEVTGGLTDATRISPPGLMNDLSKINIVNPRSWLQPLVGAAGRRGLTGDPAAALFAARQAPVAGAAGEFSPIDRTPQPPPGMTASTPPIQNSPAAAGPPGQFSLADLLAHGVEQSPPQGLSLGSAPAAPAGVPFSQNAGHMAGGLTLADELGPRTYGGQPANSDLANVMSQGVPEGIMARTAPRPSLPNPITNNASGESAASQEAINRTAAENAAGQARFLIDPDGNITPVRGVEAADARAPNGSIIVQKGIGSKPYTIIDRGGMPSAHANGLLNRAFGRSLGDEF